MYLNNCEKSEGFDIPTVSSQVKKFMYDQMRTDEVNFAAI